MALAHPYIYEASATPLSADSSGTPIPLTTAMLNGGTDRVMAYLSAAGTAYFIPPGGDIDAASGIQIPSDGTTIAVPYRHVADTVAGRAHLYASSATNVRVLVRQLFEEPY